MRRGDGKGTLGALNGATGAGIFQATPKNGISLK